MLLKSTPIDVAIFILGARLGSSPGRNYIRPDGKPYGSGTEYEFDMMMEAYRRSGRPLILFYKKEISEQQILSSWKGVLWKGGISEVENAISQFKAVNQFVEEHFYDKDKGAYIAYHLLDDKSVSFEQRLETHLREIIEKLLPAQCTSRWNGNPYKGLLSFGIEDEAIFFGRSAVLNELERELFAQCSSDEPRLPSVIVSGESGAGKSSFVKAGLLPDLLRTTVFPKSRVECRIATPGQFRNQPCEGLWLLLKEILPELPDMSQISVPDMRFAETIANALQNAIQKRIEETGLRPVPLLIVDQLEEIFTHADVTEGERTEFAKLLSALQKSNSALLVFTIRSDFYQNLTSGGEWLAIKKDALLCDLPRMTVDEYRQVITAPAELAGYKWERDERGGRRLDEVILDDAVKQQVPLPLLEFALSDIVECSGDETALTFSAYRDMGGISGAIQKRADALFKSLTPDEKAAFFSLLGLLITLNPTDGKYVRTDVPVKTVATDKMMRKAMDVFVGNRLFSVSGDEAKAATVTIAHEALISQWKVIQDWIERDRQLIQAKRDWEAAAEKWYASRKDDLLLPTTPAALAQAEDLMICWPHGLSSRVREFIARAFKKKTRRFISIRLSGVVVGVIALIFYIAALCSDELLQQAWEFGFVPVAKDEFNAMIVCMALTLPIVILALGYSLVQRFRGALRLTRARADLYVYTLALILLALEKFIETRICPTEWNIVSITMAVGMFLVPLFLVARSLFRVRYVSLRRKRLIPFRFRQPVAALLSGRLASTLSVVMTFCVVLLVSAFLGNVVSDSEKQRRQYLSMAEQFVNGRGLDVCEGIVKTLSERRQENDGIMTPGEAKILVRAKLSIGEAEDVLRDANLLQAIEVSAETTNLLYLCHCAVGDPESAYLWAKDDVFCDEYVKLFLALELGKTDDAKMIFTRLPEPPMFPLTPQLVNFAHGMLLCSNSLSEAVAMYREIEKEPNLRNSLLSDFVLLKRQEEYRARIIQVEESLTSSPIPAIEGEAANILEDMPWLLGTWRWELDSVGREFDMEINPLRRMNCRYRIFDWHGMSRVKTGVGGTLMRIQEKHVGNQYMVEEFNPQTGIVSTGFWDVKDENTIEVKVLFNGNDMDKGQKRTYRRLSTNKFAMVRAILPDSNAALQGLCVGDICCKYCDMIDLIEDGDMFADSIQIMNDEEQSLVVAHKNDSGMFEIKSFVFPSGDMGFRHATTTACVSDWNAVSELWQKYKATAASHEEEGEKQQ